MKLLLSIKLYLYLFSEIYYFRSFFSFFKSKFIFFKAFGRGKKGQAVIEYVLLLVIVVSLFYGLSRAFFTPLRMYGSSVFTNTIACSFEYGQLPSEILSEDGCAPSYQPGELVNNPQRQTSNRQASTSTKTDSAKKSEDNKTTTSESSSETSSARPTTIYSKGSALQLGKNSGAEGLSKTTSKPISEENGGRLSAIENDFNSRRSRRSISKPLTGELESIFQNQRSKKRGEINRSVASSVDSNEQKAKKFTITKKNAENEQNTASKAWDFYSILRIVLIFLIILAILIFVFFQVSQIRKGSTE